MTSYQYSGSLVLISLAIWFIALLLFRKVFKQPSETISTDYRLAFLLLVAYSTFAFADADTYHYMRIFDLMKEYETRIHVEPFYYHLTKFINNYYVWRLVIWGGASLILMTSLKKANLDATTVGFLLPCFVFREFSLTRGALGISIIMFAITCIFSEEHRLRKFIIAVFCLIAAYYLHRSMPLFLIIMVFALALPINKQTIIFSLLLFPILYILVTSVMDNLVGILESDEEIAELTEYYLELGQGTVNWKGMIQVVLQMSGIFLLIYSLCKYYLDRSNDFSRVSHFMFKYSYVLIYIAMLLYNQGLTSFLYTRVLNFATYPLLFCTSEYLYKSGKRSKLDRITLFMLAFYMFYITVYFAWKWR